MKFLLKQSIILIVLAAVVVGLAFLSSQRTTNSFDDQMFEVYGLRFTLPDSWQIESIEAKDTEWEVVINIPDPDYHVTLPLRIIDESEEESFQETQIEKKDTLLTTTDDGVRIYKHSFAMSFGSFVLYTNEEIYLVVFDVPKSDQPIENTEMGGDNIWPQADVTFDQLIELVKTVNQ